MRTEWHDAGVVPDASSSAAGLLVPILTPPFDAGVECATVVAVGAEVVKPLADDLAALGDDGAVAGTEEI